MCPIFQPGSSPRAALSARTALRSALSSSSNARPMRGKSSLFAAALLLSGCSQAGKYPEQCGALLPGWKKPTDGYGVLTLVNKVHISRDGDLRWNGRKITKDELRSFAATLPEMNPIPFTTLEVELGTSCDEVGAVREIVDR